jgi:hypothetical protein
MLFFGRSLWVRKLNSTGRLFCLTITCAAGLLMKPAAQVFGASSGSSISTPTRFSDSAVQTLNAQVQRITVKVYAGESWGSGVLIGRSGQTYTILTNDHVLHGETEFRIQTVDGQINSASHLQSISFEGNDLALLQFSSPVTDYAIASIGQSHSLQVGDTVVAGGFPAETDSAEVNGFKFTSGNISFISSKALDGGYQLGYTNAIEKGMSGGPVLNLRGEVVAINGVHPYPIWGDPYVYTDGSHPCEPLRQLMVESSWAISQENFISLIPASLLTGNTGAINSLPPSRWAGWSNASVDPQETLRLQRRANALAQCRQPE